MISNPEYPKNHLIYSIDIDLESTIFCNDSFNEHSNSIVMIKQYENEEHGELTGVILVQEKWSNLHFDGAIGKYGAGARICINGPNHENHLCSYKLYFNCTNNVSKYEALIL